MNTKHPVFPRLSFPFLNAQALPDILKISLNHPDSPELDNIVSTTRESLLSSKRLQDIPKHSRVGIAVGSRGIAGLADIVKQTVQTLKELELEPVIIPAMGSHGGGTAEGQKKVLENLGVSEKAVHAPVESSMETIELATKAKGQVCFIDRAASEMDGGIIVINRIKSHTSFDREIESGLCKMVAVGLGNAEGARNVHLNGPRGLSKILPLMAETILRSGFIVFGLGIVENSNKQICHLEGVEPEDFFEADRRLLKLAKGLLPKLPFKEMDCLIVQQIGKEISGSGMDPAVIGRIDIRGIPNPGRPFIRKIGVLNLTEKTMGNAVGIGVADYITHKLASRLDLNAMYMNSLTAANIERSRIPVVLENDEAVIKACAATCWQPEGQKIRLCIIHSTSYLNEICVSESLLKEIDSEIEYTCLTGLQTVRFSSSGKFVGP